MHIMKSFTSTNWNSDLYRRLSILAASANFKKFGFNNNFKSKIDNQRYSGRGRSAPDPDLPKNNIHCHLCEYKSARIANLRRHLATMHKNRGNVIIKCCNKSFQDLALYRIHCRAVHPNGHECVTCHKIFTRRALLERHQSVHTGIKDFKCILCPYASSHKSNLLRHVETHRKGTKVYAPRAKTNNSPVRYLPTNSLKKNGLLIGGGLHPGSVNASLLMDHFGIVVGGDTIEAAQAANFKAPVQLSQGWPTSYQPPLNLKISHSIESILSRPNPVRNQILESSWIKSEYLIGNETEFENPVPPVLNNSNEILDLSSSARMWLSLLSDLDHVLSYLAALPQVQQTNSSTVPVLMNQTPDLRLLLDYFHYFRSAISLNDQQTDNPSSVVSSPKKYSSLFHLYASNTDYLFNPLRDVNGLPYSLNCNTYSYQNHSGLDLLANQAQARLIEKQEQEKRPTTSRYCVQRGEPSPTCSDTASASASINTSFNACTFPCTATATPFPIIKTGKRESKNTSRRATAIAKDLSRKSQSHRLHHGNNAEVASTARNTRAENCQIPLKKCVENSSSIP